MKIITLNLKISLQVLQQKKIKKIMESDKSTTEINPMFIGIDLGTSSIKIAIILLQLQSQSSVYKVRKIFQKKTPQSPQQMEIISPGPKMAEQNPQIWWQLIHKTLRELFHGIQSGTIFGEKLSLNNIKGIGIAYQMHGLTLSKQINLKQQQILTPGGSIKSLRNCIIWCDGRTKQVGNKLKNQFMKNGVLNQLINYPANFTLSKLKWVKENQSYLNNQNDQSIKFMLPGDFIAAKITNKCQTSPQGLSEGAMWDYKNNQLSHKALDISGISKAVVPQIVQNFTIQSVSSPEFNKYMGLQRSIPVYYRSGDQPNNAFGLDISEPGYAAATGGTSGVIYLVTNTPPKFNQIQQTQPFNCFLHCIADNEGKPLYGNLLCINGCGISYKWIKDLINFGVENNPTKTTEESSSYFSYEKLNKLATGCNSNDILVLPFGNGPERMLQNLQVGCHINGIDYMVDGFPNILRATLEGLIFSFVYGFELMSKSLKDSCEVKGLNAGQGNLFDSDIFSEGLASLLDVPIRIYQVDGSIGAAKGAVQGWRRTHQDNEKIKISNTLEIIHEYVPNKKIYQQLKPKYKRWKVLLNQKIYNLKNKIQ